MRLIYTDTYEHLYTRNRLGYRCQEFDLIDWSNAIAVFGCSEVFGVSVEEDRTLTHYLTEYIGKPCINLGIPGGSNASISILVDSICSLFKPAHSIVIWTTPHRYPYYSLRYHRYHEISPMNYKDKHHKEQREVFRDFVSSEVRMRREFSSAVRRVRPYRCSEYTFLGEVWQATSITSRVQEFGLDGGHSAGFRCRDLAQQISTLEVR